MTDDQNIRELVDNQTQNPALFNMILSSIHCKKQRILLRIVYSHKLNCCFPYLIPCISLRNDGPSVSINTAAPMGTKVKIRKKKDNP